jgi:hypothetical protein
LLGFFHIFSFPQEAAKIKINFAFLNQNQMLVRVTGEERS